MIGLRANSPFQIKIEFSHSDHNFAEFTMRILLKLFNENSNITSKNAILNLRMKKYDLNQKGE